MEKFFNEKQEGPKDPERRKSLIKILGLAGAAVAGGNMAGEIMGGVTNAEAAIEKDLEKSEKSKMGLVESELIMSRLFDDMHAFEEGVPSFLEHVKKMNSSEPDEAEQYKSKMYIIEMVMGEIDKMIEEAYNGLNFDVKNHPDIPDMYRDAVLGGMDGDLRNCIWFLEALRRGNNKYIDVNKTSEPLQDYIKELLMDSDVLKDKFNMELINKGVKGTENKTGDSRDYIITIRYLMVGLFANYILPNIEHAEKLGIKFPKDLIKGYDVESADEIPYKWTQLLDFHYFRDKFWEAEKARIETYIGQTLQFEKYFQDKGWTKPAGN